MKPIKGNSLNKSCGEIISSNCVVYTGPAVEGVCGPNPTLTQVLTKIAASSDCCGGTFPPGSTSAYTGKWVDFSAAIPTTGFFSAGTWAVASVGGVGLYKPQYRWEPNGDLLFRGTMAINVTTSAIQSGFLIPLVNLSPLNFPSNWTATQNILTTSFFNAVGGQSIYQIGNCTLQLDYPTGLVSLNVQYADITLATLGIGPINLSARFNNA